jgi:hypothetical protein
MDKSRKPLYSLCEDDIELEDDLGDFVIGLAERVDRLQDAQATGDLEELAHGGTGLARRALDLGYPPLAAVAEKLCMACQEEKDDVIQETLMELTEVSRQVRLGHRGAA